MTDEPFDEETQEKADEILGIDSTLSLVKRKYNIANLKMKCNKDSCDNDPEKEATIEKEGKELATLYLCEDHDDLDSFEEKLNDNSDKDVKIDIKSM